MNTYKDIVEYLREEGGEGGFVDGLDPELFELTDEGDWVQDWKYQHRSSVVKHIPTGIYVQVNQSRSGSYHSDWYYNKADYFQVTPLVETKTITTTTWQLVKDDV